LPRWDCVFLYISCCSVKMSWSYTHTYIHTHSLIHSRTTLD
jgi:hypothetical protein